MLRIETDLRHDPRLIEVPNSMWYSSLEKSTKGPSVHHEQRSQLNILVVVAALECG